LAFSSLQPSTFGVKARKENHIWNIRSRRY
jgi:hypothetical protein